MDETNEFTLQNQREKILAILNQKGANLCIRSRCYRVFDYFISLNPDPSPIGRREFYGKCHVLSCFVLFFLFLVCYSEIKLICKELEYSEYGIFVSICPVLSHFVLLMSYWKYLYVPISD